MNDKSTQCNWPDCGFDTNQVMEPPRCCKTLAATIPNDAAVNAESAAKMKTAQEVLAEIEANWGTVEDDDPEAIIECLGDDAQQMLAENPEDERAINMFRAAKLLGQLTGDSE